MLSVPKKDENDLKTSIRLCGLATAVPPFKLHQEDIMGRAAELLPGVETTTLSRMLPVYENAGVQTRYSCVPADWYEKPHSWSEKNRLYLSNALLLLERAVTGAAAEAQISLSEIGAIVAVSSTGFATPSIDALLVEKLDLQRNVERSPLFGLGCAGGVQGLARAATIAQADPDKTVLLVVVELCGLTFRRDDNSSANIVATALFGDGAAAALLRAGENGPRLEFSGEFSWPNSLEIMGWRVEDDGLGVVFSRDIPSLTRQEFGDVARSFLEAKGLRLDDIDQFVCHPGGAKVLEALEVAFQLQQGGLAASRQVLQDYGNMSAVTVFFVLDQLLKEKASGRYLLSSLGPGFTAAFQTMLV